MRYQNYLTKSVFLSKLQGFVSNEREKPREEELFFQNLQRFKRRKIKKTPKKTQKKTNHPALYCLFTS